MEILSYWHIIVISIILFVTLLAVFTTKKWLDKHFEHFRHILDVKVTRYRFLKHFFLGLIFFIGVGAAIYLIPQLRSISVSIFAGAGVLAIIVGIASQHALANIIGGVFIAVFKPYRVGDWIRTGEDRWGTVEDITLRHTVIRHRDNRRVIIPNSEISRERIENASIDDLRVCEFIEIDISYDADVDKAKEIMAQEVRRHPDFFDIRSKKDIEEGKEDVKIRVIGFGDSSVKLRAWAWAKDPYCARQMRWNLNESVKKAFDKSHIEIPFPYRTIVYKKDMHKHA